MGDHRELVNGVACQCVDGYYEDPTTTKCMPCTDKLMNCLICFYNSTYNPSDSDSNEFGCFQCEEGLFLDGVTCVPAANCSVMEILNETTNMCEPCLLDGCLNCSSHTVCNECDEGSNYFLDETTLQCDNCPVVGCDICATIDSCSVCKETFTIYEGTCICLKGTYFDQGKEACEPCSSLCLYCTGPTAFECTECQQEQNRELVGSTCICDRYNYKEPEHGDACVKIDENKCDKGYVKVELTGQCVEICGDGVLLERECDDGNIVNGDGCSDQCRIEPYFVCSQIDEISICKLQTTITLNIEKLTKDYMHNGFEMEFSLHPATEVYNDYVLESILQFMDQHISIREASYSSGKLRVNADYFEDLEGKEASIEVKEEERYSSAEGVSVFESEKVPFMVKVSSYSLTAFNNLDVMEYSPEVYESARTAEVCAYVLMGVGFLCLLVGLLTKRSLATLLIFTNLQLIFYGLSCIDGLHPVTESLTTIKPVTGYHNREMFVGQEFENRRVRELGYDGSFASNFNAMLFIELGFLALSGVLFLASQKKPLLSTPYKICQKLALLVVLFCCAGLFYSLALMRLFNLINVVFAAVAIAVAVGQVLHLLRNTKTYYGMEESLNFEQSSVRAFLLVWMVSRLGLVLCVALILDDPRMGCIGAISI